MSDIENRLFRYFVALAEEQYFARAAERLGITPPTLTHQIKKLERDLGVKLLERTSNRRTGVTEAGQRFLADAREALLHVEKAAANARQAARGELGRLQLGFMASVSNAGLLRNWIGPFEQAHPAMEIAMDTMAPIAQIGGIMRKELDAGFTRPPHKYPTGVRGFEIYRQPIALALPSEHPLARREAISPAMLAGEAFVGTLPELDLGFFGYTEAVVRIGKFRTARGQAQERFHRGAGARRPRLRHRGRSGADHEDDERSQCRLPQHCGRSGAPDIDRFRLRQRPVAIGQVADPAHAASRAPQSRQGRRSA